MGEVPILTIAAHVFQIDSETKKKWLPTSQSAVDVSYYFDNAHNSYRLISLENNKVLINCTLLPNMKFMKTSQKFGQWIDSQVGTVYGLGFSSESELTKFADKFEEIRLSLSDKKRSSDPPPVKPKITHDKSNENDKNQVNKVSSNLRQMQVNNSNDISLKTTNGLPNTTTITTHTTADTKCTNIKCSNLLAHLRLENDKLKLELAQSSSRAREWEIEMQSLRNKNAMLTTTLEESRNNVDEWRKQLNNYNDEISLARDKIAEVERLEVQLNETKRQLDDAERMSGMMQLELDQLRQMCNELKRQEIKNQQSSAVLQSLEKENARLKSELRDLNEQLETRKRQSLNASTNKEQIQRLQDQITQKINELYEMNDQLAEQLQQTV